MQQTSHTKYHTRARSVVNDQGHIPGSCGRQHRLERPCRCAVLCLALLTRCCAAPCRAALSLQMRQIPGVGPYTAAAVASIAFNDPAAAVDGNVIRVLSRLRALRGNPTKMAKTWDRLAAELLHPERPGCHNQVRAKLQLVSCDTSICAVVLEAQC